MIERKFESLKDQEQQDFIANVFASPTGFVDAVVETNLLTLVDVACEGLKVHKRGVVVAHQIDDEDEDSDTKVKIRYVYIPMKSFIDLERVFPDSYQSVVDWLIDYDPNTEILFGFLVPFEGRATTSKDCKTIGVPSLCQYRRIKFDLTKDERQEIVTESKAREEVEPRKTLQKEKRLEVSLYDWMRLKGVHAEKQVSTSNKHRLDLWVPGHLILELKVGRASGDDLCQAIDYYATYKKPVVLVGTGLSTAASRGLEAFNKAVGDFDAIQFVTWAAIRSYLKGFLGLS